MKITATSVRIQAGRICDECDFWRSGESPGRGQCRRYPPTLQPDPQKPGEVRPWWPNTNGEEWCGEFRRRGDY